MLKTKKKYLVYFLLLLYIGYYATVSYYVHPHIYKGIVYLHSHPYEKDTGQSKEKQLPFEANHHHNAANFSTFNQLSNLFSPAASGSLVIELTLLLLGLCWVIYYKQKPLSKKELYFSLRAPPVLF